MKLTFHHLSVESHNTLSTLFRWLANDLGPEQLETAEISPQLIKPSTSALQPPSRQNQQPTKH